MQTSFTLAQLTDPDTAEADRILRTCVHCGFCTATCPTYVLLGDELDSPRGRIYLIKDMLESDEPARAEVVRHIDRCLSCLSCMTTCPSGVHYMHLVDHARVHIEETHKRPFVERVIRGMLARLLPNNRAFRWALRAARAGRPLADLFATLGLQSIAAMLRLAPARMPNPQAPKRRRLFSSVGPRKGRVGLLSGCVSPVIAPAINEAAIRVLTRHGIEVVVPTDACCGALVHHLGRGHEACMAARRQIDAWIAELEQDGLDAIVVTASGCGTMVKDYGYMLRTDRAYAAKAKRVSRLAMDISEYLTRLPLRATCCGSAGTYNILQPELAWRLRERKVANIEKVKPDVVAAGNLGCITQIAAGTAIPVVHTVELIDWATGGSAPEALAGKELPPRQEERRGDVSVEVSSDGEI
jgi:glycolate oxidase iron-sulfur subunit